MVVVSKILQIQVEFVGNVQSGSHTYVHVFVWKKNLKKKKLHLLERFIASLVPSEIR